MLTDLPDTRHLSSAFRPEMLFRPRFSFNFNLRGSHSRNFSVNVVKFTFYVTTDFPIVEFITDLGITINDHEQEFFSSDSLESTNYQLEKKFIDILTTPERPYYGDLLGIKGSIRLTKNSTGSVRITLELLEHQCGSTNNFGLLTRLHNLNVRLLQLNIDDQQAPLPVEIQTITPGFTHETPAEISEDIRSINTFAENVNCLFDGLVRSQTDPWKHKPAPTYPLTLMRQMPSRITVSAIPDPTNTISEMTMYSNHSSRNSTTTTGLSSTTAVGRHSTQTQPGYTTNPGNN